MCTLDTVVAAVGAWPRAGVLAKTSVVTNSAWDIHA